MAIDTDNEKLSLMTYGSHWMGPTPFPVGVAIDQGDAQHLLAGYPGILWSEIIGGFSSRKQSRYIIPLIE